MTEFFVGDRVRVLSTAQQRRADCVGTVVVVHRNLGGGTVLSYQVRLDDDAAQPERQAHAVMKPKELESAQGEDRS